MSTQETGRVLTPPAPGAESAGPMLADLVTEVRRSAQAMEALFRHAKFDAIVRTQLFRVSIQLDANGDGAQKLFEVPQGAQGFIAHCAVDESGVTPASPDTSANLFHGIYGLPGGSQTAAQARQFGTLLDCSPQSPIVDAQIPFVYLYGSQETAPTLFGPEAFWLIVDAGTANASVTARGKVIVIQPDA